jgi:hypothetical protein
MTKKMSLKAADYNQITTKIYNQLEKAAAALHHLIFTIAPKEPTRLPFSKTPVLKRERPATALKPHKL